MSSVSRARLTSIDTLLRDTSGTIAGVPAQRAVDDLTGVVRHCDPWPEAPAALEALRRRFTVVALSNGDLSAAEMSRGAGRAWHAVLSAQFASSSEPAAVVYRTALDSLEVHPSRVLMVAAHP